VRPWVHNSRRSLGSEVDQLLRPILGGGGVVAVSLAASVGTADTPVWVLGDADRTWLAIARSSFSGGVNLLLFLKVSRRGQMTLRERVGSSLRRVYAALTTGPIVAPPSSAGAGGRVARS
jgi:hypothetical protein